MGMTDWITLPADEPPAYVIDGRLSLDHEDMLRQIPGRDISKSSVRRFFDSGPSLETSCIARGVHVVAPGSAVKVRDGTVVEIATSGRPTGPALSNSAVESELVRCLERRLEGGNAAFALSGGVDSTLLVALAVRHQLCHPVCFVADTGAGQDLEFAQQAADALGVELHVVVVPGSESVLELHRLQTRQAGGPIALTGNSIGFGFICRAAKEAGFRAIIDGTGAEQIFAGNYLVHGAAWAATQRGLKRDGQVEAYVEICERQGIGRKSVEQAISRQAASGVTFNDFMWQDFTSGRLRIWDHQHRATERALGIAVRMPYVDAALLPYLNHDPNAWFQNGLNKSVLRAILARHGLDGVAGRIDNQGLRWPTKTLLKVGGRAMAKTIYRSGIVRYLTPLQRLLLRLRLDKGLFLKSYAVAVTIEEMRPR